MPATTQDLDKYLKIASSLYEAVMVISKRARQINEELFQKKRDKQILEELDGGGFETEFLQLDQEEIEREPIEEEPEENPVVTAQREFLDGKLEFHYEPGRK